MTLTESCVLQGDWYCKRSRKQVPTMSEAMTIAIEFERSHALVHEYRNNTNQRPRRVYTQPSRRKYDQRTRRHFEFHRRECIIREWIMMEVSSWMNEHISIQVQKALPNTGMRKTQPAPHSRYNLLELVLSRRYKKQRFSILLDMKDIVIM